MTCEKCGAEMTLQQELPLNFTSPALAESGLFKAAAIQRNALIYTCAKCRNFQYEAAPAEENEE